MAKGIENEIMKLAEPVADKLGLYVVDVEFKKENGERFLWIYIDKEGGVGINDCEAFSREFDSVIDAADPIAESYNLEVSSPGADRILKTEREFKYYIGREVEVKLYSAINSMKEFEGILKDFSDNTAVIQTQSGEDIEVPTKQAVYIRLAFKF